MYVIILHLFILTDIDECESAPCSNGGICNNFPGEYECICGSGFTGSNCEIGEYYEWHIIIITIMVMIITRRRISNIDNKYITTIIIIIFPGLDSLTAL